MTTSIATWLLPSGRGPNAPTLVTYTYLIMGVLFFMFMTWMLFSAAPSARAGARVYLACRVPTQMFFPIFSIGVAIGVPYAGWHIFTALAGDQITLSKSIFMAGLALVFNVPFTIVCLDLFRRMYVMERSQVVYCLGCGQDLSGISSYTCPECGNVYKPEDLQTQAL